MALVDLVVKGQPIAPISNFDTGNGYESDFSDPNLFGTSSDLNSRDGQLGIGFYAQSIDVGWGESAYGPAQINGEEQHYINNRNANPSGYYPYEVVSNVLRVSSRPTTTAEQSQYFIKGYYLIPTGEQAQANWFNAANGFSGGIPADWMPVNEGWDSGNSGNDNNTGGVVRFDKLPAKYLAGMVHTYGRFTMSFGSVEYKLKSDTGGQGMSESDIRNVNALFAAAWGLQAIHYEHDFNGQPTPNSTQMPSQPNADGIIEEIDCFESFSENNRIAHQTLHWHDPEKQQAAEGIPLSFDIDSGFNTFGWHSIANPAGGGKVGFFINGIYTKVIDMPDTFRDQMPIYQAAANGYQPDLSSGSANITGYQTNSDGSPKHMQFALIANIARDSKLVRDAIRTYGDPADVPPYEDVASIEIEHIKAYPQLVENPDTWGVTKYGVPVSTSSIATPTDNAKLVIQTQPAYTRYGPKQHIVAIPKNGYDTTGKTFTWSSDVIDLEFIPQGSLVTSLSISNLTADQIATITVSDGE